MYNGLPQHGSTWFWLIGLGALHTGVAYVLMFTGFSKLASGRVAVLQFIYPLTAFLVDWKFYGHTLSAVQFLGLAFMAIAIVSTKKSG